MDFKYNVKIIAKLREKHPHIDARPAWKSAKRTKTKATPHFPSPTSKWNRSKYKPKKCNFPDKTGCEKLQVDQKSPKPCMIEISDSLTCKSLHLYSVPIGRQPKPKRPSIPNL